MPINIRVVLAFTLLFTSLALFGQDYQPIPDLKTRVTDNTRTLSDSEKNSIENTLQAFENEFGSQVVVVIVPTTYPEEIEQYSIRLAEQWKIGRGEFDDGVILLIAKEDRKLRIEVGYGLEGAIPDAYAKRIIEQIIVPEFRGGDFYHGITKGIDAIQLLIKGEELPEPVQTSSDSSVNLESLSPLIFIGAFILFAFLKVFAGRWFGSLIFFVISFIFMWIIANFIMGLIVSFAATIFMNLFSMGKGGGGGWTSGGSSGGGWSSGGSSFSGGGGSFGGGGASGSW